MYDGFHSFVCGDCCNLSDFACVEWGKKRSVLPKLFICHHKYRMRVVYSISMSIVDSKHYKTNIGKCSQCTYMYIALRMFY
jgi:hypothetical protein